jgi:Gti1/Pac2 family transcription factor
MSHYDRSNHHPMGLVKQAYSAWVQLAPNTKPKKWHLTAYFTYSDLQHIPTIDHDPILQRITIPPGIYKSGKARSRNSVSYGDDHGSNGPQSPPPSHSPSPTPMPSNVRYALNQGGNRPMGQGQTAYPQGYSDPVGPRSSTPRPGNVSPPPTLPPIRTAIPELHPSSSWSQVPRPAEDQRLIQMLNSRPFR